MSRVNTLQMSLFGNFINIKPKNDIIIRLLTALQEEQFIPGSADVANIDIKSGKVVVDSRMQLVSPDKTWVIVFLGDRIDFNYVYQKGTSAYTSTTRLIEYGKKLIEKVFALFADTTGSRLAVNCSVIFENLKEDEIKEICNRYTKPLNLFSEDSYTEWGIRFNSRDTVSFNDKNELCNRIVEMQLLEHVNGDNQSADAIQDIILSIDINTAQGTTDLLYKYLDLLCFADEASNIITNVFKEIEV